MGVGGWDLFSEDVKERLRGMGSGGRSDSTSAVGVRKSGWRWAWSLCNLDIEPYSGLSNISDSFSSSLLEEKNPSVRISLSIVGSHQV